MGTGKDKLLRYMRIYVGPYDLSGDARTIGTLANSVTEVEIGGWDDEVKNFISDDQRIVGITGFQALLNDLATGAWDILKDYDQASVGVLFGGGGAPAIGDPAYLLRAEQIMDTAGFDGGAGVIQSDFPADADQYDADAYDPIGVVLHPSTSLAATTDAASVDEAASSALGGHAILIVEVSSGGTWVLKIQDSANDAAWADLITFTADGSTVTAEVNEVSGSVDRYVRFQATRTSGTVTPVCLWARNL